MEARLDALLARSEPMLYAGLRCAFGLIIFSHGLPKALRTGHGSMADPLASAMAMIAGPMGLPFSTQLAILVMLLETIGAVLLAVGLWTRLIALGLAVEMAGISYALGPTWPWIDRGIEYPILLGCLSIYLVARGSGPLALERLPIFAR